MRFFLFALALGATGVIFSCQKSSNNDSSHHAGDNRAGKNPNDPGDGDAQKPDEEIERPLTDWEKKRRLGLLGRRMHLGSDLPLRDVEALYQLEPEKVIDQLMSNEKFAHTIFDFSMYFTGFKSFAVVEDGKISMNVTQYPQVLNAVHRFLEGGDYLELYNPYPPFYIAPASGKISAFTRRTELDRLIASAKRFKDFLADHPDATAKEKCAFVIDPKYPVNSWPKLDLPYNFLFFFRHNWELDRQGCYLPDSFKYPDFVRMNDEILEMLLALKKFLPTLHAYSHPKKLADVLHFDTSSMQAENPHLWNRSIFAYLQNSSTNFNRRRAAYILKRYFCDDLSPDGILLDDSTDASDGHGGSAACQSCHFKLDPMAGFFHEYGKFFLSHKGQRLMQFSDEAFMDNANYQKAWPRNEFGTVAGYIRSASDTSVNEYGNDLTDLFRIIRKAPESSHCMVKQLYRYFIDENQLADSKFIATLGARFHEEAKTNSTQALKNAIKEILLSKTFSARNRQADTCYERKGGDENQLPCNVSYIVENHCQVCHSGSGAAGGLQLDTWKAQPDGSFSFAHHRGGAAVDSRTTMAAIADRLLTKVEGLRMPPSDSMNSKDRQTLYVWANGEKIDATKSALTEIEEMAPDITKMSRQRDYLLQRAILNSRIMPEGSDVISEILGGNSALIHMIGDYYGTGPVSGYSNVFPSSTNAFIWHLIFTKISDRLSGVCGGSRSEIPLRSEFVEAAQGLCTWPEAEAHSDKTLDALWYQVMRYDAPEEELVAWKETLRHPDFLKKEPAEAVASAVYLILFNPYFLVRDS